MRLWPKTTITADTTLLLVVFKSIQTRSESTSLQSKTKNHISNVHVHLAPTQPTHTHTHNNNNTQTNNTTITTYIKRIIAVDSILRGYGWWRFRVTLFVAVRDVLVVVTSSRGGIVPLVASRDGIASLNTSIGVWVVVSKCGKTHR